MGFSNQKTILPTIDKFQFPYPVTYTNIYITCIMPAMKLKIISDGTTQKTQVLDENGNDLSDKILGMAIHFKIGKPVYADIQFVGVEVDIVAEIKEAE